MAKMNTEKTNPKAYRQDQELDALLDKARLSMASTMEIPGSPAEEDSEEIDRLLKDAGFSIEDGRLSASGEESGAFDLNDGAAVSRTGADENRNPPAQSAAAKPADAESPAERSAGDFDDHDLAEQLQAFSDFDEFDDFREFEDGKTVFEPPAQASDKHAGSEASGAGDYSGMETLNEYDEFGDDADDFYASVTAAAKPAAASPEAAYGGDGGTAEGQAHEFNITADGDPDFYGAAFAAGGMDSAARSGAREETDSAAFHSALSEQAAALALLTRFKSEQESLNKDQGAVNKKNQKHLAEAAAAARKAVALAYAGLVFGAAACIAAAVSGFIAYKAKTELAQLIDTRSATAAPAVAASAAAAKNPEPSPAGPATLADSERVPSEARKSPAATEAPPAETGFAEPVPPAFGQTAAGAAESEPETAASIPASAASAADAGRSAAKSESSAPRPGGPGGIADEPAAAIGQSPEPESPASGRDASPEAVPPSLRFAQEPKPASAAAVDVARAKMQDREAGHKNWKRKNAAREQADVQLLHAWTVNLAAFQNKWEADGKAAEFSEKGVPVEMVTVKKRGRIWHQLRVSGFADKEEAGAYKKRAEKALGLRGVWIGK